MKASANRGISVLAESGRSDFLVDRHTPLKIRGLELQPGMNCVFVESKDKVLPLPRYMSLFRSGVPLDGRILNFAISQIAIEPILQ